MKILISILAFILCFSCDENSQEVALNTAIEKITIPDITKNKTDVLFQLKNGVLYFDKETYTGIVNDFYENGNLKSISEYYNGKRQGKYFGWYPNKQKWFERFYTSGLKSGIHQGWHKNGTLMFEYYFNNNGSYNGSVKDWCLNGVLANYFNFIEGKETGSQKMWDLKGKIRANFYTVNGERHGLIGLKKCISVVHDTLEIK